MTLKIYDGANSNLVADLDNGTTTAIRRGGWSQRGPQPLPGDLWADVEETVVVTLLTADNSLYSTLMALARRAEEVQSPTHRDYLNPARWVTAEAKTPDEQASRWAQVKAITVEKLDPAHYRANGRTALEVKFVREGTWRGIRPGDPQEYLRLYATMEFWKPLDLPGAGTPFVAGDAPPDVTFGIRPYAFNDVAICRFESWEDGDELPEFTPYLWADEATPAGDQRDISSLPATFAGAYQLPGGKCLELSTLENYYLWRSLDTRHYAGSYVVYGLFLKGAPGTVSITLLHGRAGAPVTGEAQTLTTASVTAWYMLQLGTMTVDDERIYGQVPSDDYVGSYQVGVITQSSHDDNAYLGGLILVPYPDHPPQAVNCFGAERGNPLTVANGELRRTYWTTSAGVLQGFAGLPADGPYQTLVPGAATYNRLHLIPLPGSGYGDAHHFPTLDDWRVYIRYIPRWQYLNQTGLEEA